MGVKQNEIYSEAIAYMESDCTDEMDLKYNRCDMSVVLQGKLLCYPEILLMYLFIH